MITPADSKEFFQPQTPLVLETSDQVGAQVPLVAGNQQ